MRYFSEWPQRRLNNPSTVVQKVYQMLKVITDFRWQPAK